MKLGKIPEIVLTRSVLKQINHRREEVLVGPAIGEDCSVLAIADDEVLVLSTDPITGTTEDIGTLAVHITANDIASNGAEMIGIMLTILLPQYSDETGLKTIMKEIEMVCQQLNIEVLGGHTEVTRAVNQPIITVTGVGKMKRSDLIKTSGAKPGQEIVMTKWAGLEGTAIIATAKEEELKQKYSQSFLQGAKDMIHHISVVPEARIAKEVGVTSMHDVTEGGIYGALWEIGAASNVGMEVDINKILLRQETVEICEYYDLNPYKLISSGCMLIVTEKANLLVKRLEEEGIPASVIGHITADNDRLVRNQEERRYLEPAKSDELYKVMQ